MRTSLNFRQKVLLLIAVPVIFEIAFVTCLALLLHRAEAETARVEHAKVVIETAAGVGKELSICAASLSQYAIADHPVFKERYFSAAEQASEKIRQLHALTQDDAIQRKHAEQMKQLGKKILSFGDEAIHLIAEKDFSFVFIHAKDLRSEFLYNFKKLSTEIDAVIRHERAKQAASPGAAARLRALVYYLLIAGVLLSILLALALSLYFTKATVLRLNSVMDNTNRLAGGRPLNPPLSGTDEISHLDRVFRDMAEALTKSINLLRASEARTRTVIDHTLVGLIILDPTGLIESVNPRVEQMFGYGNSELTGRPLSMLFAPGLNGESNVSRVEDLLIDRTGQILEFETQSKDGKEISVALSLNEFESADGPRLLANVLDITKQHEIERLKQQFFAMVSHDLKTPMTSIQAFLNMIANGVYGELSEKAVLRAKFAETSAIRLISLINDLLQIEKLSSGHLSMHLEDVPLQTIVETSVESVRGFADMRAITIASPHTDLSVHADTDRLVQVLVNLLSNAIKFSPEGGTVTVDASLADGFVEVRVKDDGRGIPAQYQQAIFERFKQIAREDETEKGGTGLGLPICREIVKAHRGEIGVHSKEGEGSIFWFRIPAAKQTHLPWAIEGTGERS